MTKRASIASLIPGSQDIYRKIVLEIADGIIGIDESGIIRLCNPAAENIFGWETGQLLGKPLEVVLPERMHSSHRMLVSNFLAGDTDARYMGQRSNGIEGRRSDGAGIHLGITILRTAAAGEPLMIAVVRDISERVRYQQDLKRLAETDPLSGLLNRRAFRNCVAESLTRVSPVGSSLALFDLDDFKGVNDRYGHDAGDEVITRFADVLRTSTRANDFVGRWGGEEFIVFLPDTTPDAATAIVERIRAGFSDIDFHWERGAPVRLTVSAGIASGEIGQGELDAMVSCADKALYEAKRGGRNRLISTVMQQIALAS